MALTTNLRFHNAHHHRIKAVACASVAATCPVVASVLVQAESGYAIQARDNTIREVGRLKDPRGVPVLMRLLNSPVARVRHLSAEALGVIGSAESRTALDRVARNDPDADVREAATGALSMLGPRP